MTSLVAVSFLAVTLQTTFGLRPIIAGLLLPPIYLVMMVGPPLSGAKAAHLGGRRVIVAGLASYTAGLWLLSDVSPMSAVPRDVLVPLAVFAVGMAIFTAPLAAATMRILGDDKGIDSGVNNGWGQLVGLLPSSCSRPWLECRADMTCTTWARRWTQTQRPLMTRTARRRVP